MIDRYLEALNQKLNRYEMFKHDKDAYMHDVKESIRLLKQQGKSETEIIDALKTPKELTEDLNQRFHKKRRMPFTDKILVVSPLLVLTSYLILGLFFHLWHPGWVIIFSIPGLALCFELLNDPDKPLYKAILPLFIMIAFFVFTIGFSMWIFALSILALLPLIGVLNGERLKKRPIETVSIAMPFFTIFITLNLYAFITSNPLIWHILMVNPLIWMFNIKATSKKLLYSFTLILFIISYLTVAFLEENFTRAYLIYIGLIPYFINPIKRDSLFPLDIKTFLTAISIGVFGVLMLGVLELYAFIMVPFIIYTFLYTLPKDSLLSQWLMQSVLFTSFVAFGLFAALNVYLFSWWVLIIIVVINAFFKGKLYVRT